MCRTKQFLRDESGMEAVEYGVIAGLIVIGALTAITVIGMWVQSTLVNFDHELNAASAKA